MKSQTLQMIDTVSRLLVRYAKVQKREIKAIDMASNHGFNKNKNNAQEVFNNGSGEGASNKELF